MSMTLPRDDKVIEALSSALSELVIMYIKYSAMPRNAKALLFAAEVAQAVEADHLKAPMIQNPVAYSLGLGITGFGHAIYQRGGIAAMDQARLEFLQIADKACFPVDVADDIFREHWSGIGGWNTGVKK